MRDIQGKVMFTVIWPTPHCENLWKRKSSLWCVVFYFILLDCQAQAPYILNASFEYVKVVGVILHFHMLSTVDSVERDFNLDGGAVIEL